MNDRQIDTPKFIAQKCPVCNGFGTLSFGKKTCHGCKGSGVVVIDNDTGILIDRKKDTQNEN